MGNILIIVVVFFVLIAISSVVYWKYIIGLFLLFLIRQVYINKSFSGEKGFSYRWKMYGKMSKAELQLLGSKKYKQAAVKYQ